MNKIQRMIEKFWPKLKMPVVAAVILLLEDWLDGLHAVQAVALSPGLLGSGQESTGDVSIIDAIAKGIACFFGAC